MNKEEIQAILDEMHQVRPEILNNKAKKLFYAFMSIADERDKYKNVVDRAIKYIKVSTHNLPFEDYEAIKSIDNIEIKDNITEHEFINNLLKILKEVDKYEFMD